MTVEQAGEILQLGPRMVHNTIKRVPLDELAALCRYFNCNVGAIPNMEEEHPA